MNLTKIKKAIMYLNYMATEYNNPLIFFKYLKRNDRGFVLLERRDGAVFKTRRNIWDYFVINEIFSKRVYSFLEPGSDTHPIIHEGGTIIDIGAHIGVFSIYMAKKYPNTRILAYEPFSENFKLLKENILLNNLQNRVIPHNRAVISSSAPEGQTTLYLNETNPACHSIAESYYPGGVPTEVVQTTTLKKIFHENGVKSCSLLKLDCEKSEFDIIFSSREELDNTKAICFEHNDYDRLPLAKKFLSDAGFKIKAMYYDILFYCYR